MSTTKNEHNPETELKPCPFCGGPAEHDSQHYSGRRHAKIDSGHAIYCANTQCIGCPAFSEIFETKEDAVAAWNRRITPPTDTTGSGMEGETPETDAAEHGPGRGGFAGHCSADFARKLERQRDAALAQVEALRRDGERLDWLEKNAAKELKIDNDGTYVQLDRWHRKYITAHSWTEPTLRAAIDSAQRQEGR